MVDDMASPHMLSASLLIFRPRNPQNSSTEPDELLDHWSYFDPMFPEHRTRDSRVMMSGPNALFSSMYYFHQKFFLI